jgi:hypothetical protein
MNDGIDISSLSLEDHLVRFEIREKIGLSIDSEIAQIASNFSEFLKEEIKTMPI